MGSYLHRETLKIQREYGEAVYMEDLMLPGLGTMEGAEREGSGTTEGESLSRNRQGPLHTARQERGENDLAPALSSLPPSSHWPALICNYLECEPNTVCWVSPL